MRIFRRGDNYLAKGFNFQYHLIINNDGSSDSNMSQTGYSMVCFPMKSSFDFHKAVYIRLVLY